MGRPLRWQASSYSLIGVWHKSRDTPQSLVGAGLLAMGSPAPRLSNDNASSLTSIASKLAPTAGICVRQDKSGTQKKWRPHQRLPLFQPTRFLAVYVKLKILVLHLLVLAVGADCGDRCVELLGQAGITLAHGNA